jgi:hypothetical protein
MVMNSIEEKYFGCECMDLNHISRFGYFPPEKGEKVDEDDNVIYFTVKTEYLFGRILPPFSLNPLDWKFDLGNYFHFHILKRIPVALGYIFNPHYYRKYGISDCFDFQEKDLPIIKEFLSKLSEKETEEKSDSILWIDNERWLIRFSIQRIDKDFPYQLGWDIQFISRNLFGRIKYALKYLFGRVAEEQEFEIKPKHAEQLKGLISLVGRLNA